MSWELWIKQNILTGKKRFKNPVGHEYSDWETVKLKDVLECKNSVHDLSDVDKEESGKYPLFTTGKLYKKVPWYDMDVDYISINFRGSPGKCYLLPRCTSVNSTQAYLYLKEDVDANLKWIFANVYHIHFEKYIQGTTIKGIKWNDFKNETIPLPCCDEQNKIGDFIYTLALYSQLMGEELKLWKLMKKLMMQKLFV